MEGRPLVREASIEEYRKNPRFAEEAVEMPPLESIYGDWDYSKGYQWGMAIDLNACTGCNACVVACQAENNIPMVGKEQVMRGREMHWIRMDRYYSGDETIPKRCSSRCRACSARTRRAKTSARWPRPRTAPKGLNDMAYNRCVGTRYCANNCPYKVRRFNFLDWHKHMTGSRTKMVYNPDVTVRMRGIMEKCTYCVQRIQEAKIRAKADGRRADQGWRNPDRLPADLPGRRHRHSATSTIPNSRVAKLKKQERNYAMLAELDVRPRTTYLARLRNPNPELSIMHGRSGDSAQDAESCQPAAGAGRATDHPHHRADQCASSKARHPRNWYHRLGDHQHRSC